MESQRLLRFLRLLEQIPIEYMVTGSIAAIVYGKPRLTHDIDVVVVLFQSKLKEFIQCFDTDEFYCPPLEAIRQEIQRGDQGHMNIIDQISGLKIDLYPFEKDPLVQWGFEYRKRIEILPKEGVWVAPPEYVILKKLIYHKEGGSEKHLEDIRAMLEISGNAIDKKTILTWAKKLQLEAEWSRI